MGGGTAPSDIVGPSVESMWSEAVDLLSIVTWATGTDAFRDVLLFGERGHDLQGVYDVFHFCNFVRCIIVKVGIARRRWRWSGE